jgi:hypothetical protein
VAQAGVDENEAFGSTEKAIAKQSAHPAVSQRTKLALKFIVGMYLQNGWPMSGDG